MLVYSEDCVKIFIRKGFVIMICGKGTFANLRCAVNLLFEKRTNEYMTNDLMAIEASTGEILGKKAKLISINLYIQTFNDFLLFMRFRILQCWSFAGSSKTLRVHCAMR